MIQTQHNLTRVTLEDIGEGICGDYNQHDPQDTPLLRFYIERAELVSADQPKDFQPVDDGSFCTNIPADTPANVQRELATLVLMAAEKRLDAGEGVKKLAEQLSWLSPDPVVVKAIRREVERDTGYASS